MGNTMIDSLLACKEKAESSSILNMLGLYRRGVVNGSASLRAELRLAYAASPRKCGQPRSLPEHSGRP